MGEKHPMILRLHALHRVTGDMAVVGFGEGLTMAKMNEWGDALLAVAREIKMEAKRMRPPTKATRRKLR